MILTRWQPFQEIEALQEEINRVFDSATPTACQKARFVPPAELEDTPEAILLKLEIPGLQAEDFDVQVTAEAVSIKGERRRETEAEEKGKTRSEFRYGSFQRIIRLPKRVQNDKVEAEYKNGILHLTLPKAEAEKNKVVKVKIS